MYTLILTKSERDAFDWVGDRYFTGEETKKLLLDCLPEGVEWDSDKEITFNIPEHIAWEIENLAERENYSFPCFAKGLFDKMYTFCLNIV